MYRSRAFDLALREAAQHHVAPLPHRRRIRGPDVQHALGTGHLAHGLQRPAVDRRRQRRVRVAAVRCQLLLDRTLHLGLLLDGHQTPIDHHVGQRQRLLRGPRCAGLRQTIRVDRPVLEGDDAKQQVPLGVHDSLIDQVGSGQIVGPS